MAGGSSWRINPEHRARSDYLNGPHRAQAALRDGVPRQKALTALIADGKTVEIPGATVARFSKHFVYPGVDRLSLS